jgi:hypothetical protein
MKRFALILASLGPIHFLGAAVMTYLLILSGFVETDVYDTVLLAKAVGLTWFAAYIIKSETVQARYFSPLFIFSMLMIMHYGIPVMYFSIYNLFEVSLNEPYIHQAYHYICFAYFMLIGFAKWIYSRSPKSDLKTPSAVNGFDPKKLLFFFVAVFIISLWAKYRTISSNSYFQATRAIQQDGLKGPFYAVIVFFESFSLYAALAIFIHYLLNGGRFWKRLSLIALLFEFIYWLPTGRKEEVIIVILFPIIAYTIIKKKLPNYKLILVILVMAVAIFPITKIFRDSVGTAVFAFNSLSLSDIPTIVQVGGTAVAEAPDLEGARSNFTDSRFRNFSTVQRFCLLQEASAIFRLKETGVVIEESSYANFFVAFIPRILWEDKPSIAYGNKFGKVSGLVDDDFTSTAATVIGESYLNLGYAGFVILWIIYILAWILYRQSLLSKYRAGYLFLYIFYLKTYMYIGGDFNGQYSGIVKLFIFMFCIVWLLKQGNNTKERRLSA